MKHPGRPCSHIAPAPGNGHWSVTKNLFSFTLQGGVCGIIVCGLKTVRVWTGNNEIPITLIHIQLMVQNAIVMYCLLIALLIMLTKFMYICIWKRLRQMNDDLIVKISIVWVTFIR